MSVALNTWVRYSDTGTLNFISDGVYNLYGETYRDSASMITQDSFFIKSDAEHNKTIYVEWQELGGNYRSLYLKLLHNDGTLTLNDPRFTSDHSYGDSILVPSGSLFTSITINTDSITTATCTGAYLDDGGTLLQSHTVSITFNSDCYLILDFSDNYEASNSGVGVLSTTVSGSYFDGNFLLIDTLENLDSDYITPIGALVSTTLGTGLLNSNGSTVYLKTNDNISKGEIKHIINEELSFNLKLDYSVDGVLKLTENDEIREVNCNLDIVGIIQFNGQIVIVDEDGTIIISSYLYDYFNLKVTTAVNDGEVFDTLVLNKFDAGDVYASCFPLIQSPKPSWANHETVEQANLRSEQTVFNNLVFDIQLAARHEFYKDLYDQQGVRRESGYFESTVSISGTPVQGYKVMCLTNLGVLIDETTTDIDGVYRFDHLFVNEKYMFIAQSNKDTKTQPDYLAVASDWQTPISYTA